MVDSSFADSFGLKGGVLLASCELCRPTRDVDTQAIDFVLDQEHRSYVIAPIAAAAMDDGVVSDTIPSRIEQFGDEEEY